MFELFKGPNKFITQKNIYLKLILPITFIVALCFHKFAAVFIIFATLGLYLLKEESIKENIISLLKSIPVQLIIIFWIWAGITLFWTLNFENGLLTWIKLFGMFSLGILIFSMVSKISNTNVTRIFYILTLNVMIVIIAHLFMSRFEMEFVKPLAYFMALFTFPSLLFLYNYLPKKLRFLVLVLLTFSIFALQLSGAQSGFIGFVLGIIVFALTFFKPRSTTLILQVLTFFGTLFTPVLMSVFTYHYKLLPYATLIGTSLYHRFCIWNFATHKLFEHPIIGWGIGASKNFPGSKELIYATTSPEQLQYFENLDIDIIYWAKTFIINMPLHPHNNALQVYLELGLIGAIFYALFLASIFQVFLRVFKDKLSLASANAMAVLTLLIFNMSHSIWHMWLLSWIILSFAMLYMISLYRMRNSETNDLKP